MKFSTCSLVVTLALLSEFYLNTLAAPMAKADEIDIDQGVLTDGAAENSLSLTPASARIIVVADPGLLRTLKVLDRSNSLLNGPESILTAERREVSEDPKPNIAIIRRDTMRCMVGRVYRPCWEV